MVIYVKYVFYFCAVKYVNYIVFFSGPFLVLFYKRLSFSRPGKIRKIRKITIRPKSGGKIYEKAHFSLVTLPFKLKKSQIGRKRIVLLDYYLLLPPRSGRPLLILLSHYKLSKPPRTHHHTHMHYTPTTFPRRPPESESENRDKGIRKA